MFLHSTVLQYILLRIPCICIIHKQYTPERSFYGITTFFSKVGTRCFILEDNVSRIWYCNCLHFITLYIRMKLKPSNANTVFAFIFQLNQQNKFTGCFVFFFVCFEIHFYICLLLSITQNSSIEAGANLPPFYKLHFQNHFTVCQL